MTDKKPRKNKKKEEIAWEIKQKQEAARKRGFVAEVFFPALQKHTKSIHQAKTVCKILQNDIMSTFNQGMRNTVASLELAKKMEDDTTEGANAYRELIDAFKDLPISEALELIGGMPEAIEGGLSIEEWGRSLDDMEYLDGTMKIKPKPTIEELAAEAKCNEFRQLGDGTWVAYSNQEGELEAIRAIGPTLEAALINLKANQNAS